MSAAKRLCLDCNQIYYDNDLSASNCPHCIGSSVDHQKKFPRVFLAGPNVKEHIDNFLGWVTAKVKRSHPDEIEYISRPEVERLLAVTRARALEEAAQMLSRDAYEDVVERLLKMADKARKGKS